MKTISVNLVPLRRREAKQRRRRIRCWAAACAVYAALLVVVFFVTRPTTGPADRALRDEVEEARLLAATANDEVSALRSDLKAVLDELEANTAVGRQPDWSVLLALLSATLSEQVVLRTVAVTGSPPKAAVDAEATDEPPPIGLEFTGLGRSQAAVSRLLLRLERIPLFQSVKLIDTRREPFLDGDAVAFGVGCKLETGGEAPP